MVSMMTASRIGVSSAHSIELTPASRVSRCITVDWSAALADGARVGLDVLRTVLHRRPDHGTDADRDERQQPGDDGPLDGRRSAASLLVVAQPVDPVCEQRLEVE